MKKPTNSKSSGSTKKGVSSPKTGMNRSKADFDLSNIEYSFALNSNFHDEHGSGELNLQNEPSNILCSGFNEGYKVIGHKFDLNAERTYFFLTNPDTGCSEIGYINSFYSIDGIQQVETQCDCKIQVVLENPLEDQVQVATCEYHKLVSDCGPAPCEDNRCLGFDINFPIHESNIHLKDEVIGRTLYFTDGKNPQRYIQLDRLEIYTQDIDPCTGEIIPECLDCEEMRIFQLFEKPCLEVDIIQNGGNLRAGSYEAVIAYCSSEGLELSDYYSLTNPTPIFDKNNNILDQTDLDYITNFSIKLKLTDLDNKYEYYKIAVIRKSGLDQAVTTWQYGVYPIDNEIVTINSLLDKGQPLKGNEGNRIMSRRPFYLTARGLASGNGQLFQYGLTSHREVNLQPVVNLLGSMVKWSTLVANEDLYEDGANISKYRGYMRDEVVPCSIKFFFDGGYESPLFFFIPRPPSLEELEELSGGYPEDTNNASILSYNPDCTGNDRNKRWQFENTAEIIGDCLVPANPAYSTEVIYKEVTKSCFVDLPSATLAGPASVPITSNEDLVAYINNNIDDIIASSDPLWADIALVLSTDYSGAGDCTPIFDETCEAPVLDSETVKALSTSSQDLQTVSAPLDTYPQIQSLANDCACCSFAQTTGSGGSSFTLDTAFIATYMRPWEDVYLRPPQPALTGADLCVNAVQIMEWQTNFNPISPILQPPYAGGLSNISSIQTAIPVSVFDLPPNLTGFSAFLHIEARWYEVDISDPLTTQGGSDIIIINLSESTFTVDPDASDDICDNRMRVSFFDGCVVPTEVPQYSRIIQDMALPGDPDKFIAINTADFPSGKVSIALDSPVAIDVEFDIVLTEIPTADILEVTLSETVGVSTSDFVINAVSYLATFNNNLSDTADDFVTDWAADLLVLGITVTANVDALGGPAPGVLIFESDPTIIFTFTNITGDLNASDVLVPVECDEGTVEVEMEIDGVIQTWNIDLVFDLISPFSPDLVQTAQDFITNNTTPTTLNGTSYDILDNTDDIEVTVLNEVLTFRTTLEEFDTLTLTIGTGCLEAEVTVIEEYYTIRPFCGCSRVVWRMPELIEVIEYTGLTFVMEQIWTSTCEFSIPKLGNCDPIPWQYGLFSHWESTDTYPCNKDLFDSSDLNIYPAQLDTYMSASEKEEFEEYYVQQTIPGVPDVVPPGPDNAGSYIWKEDASLIPLTNFMDRPIRHYKFPCSITVPFMSYGNQNPGPFKDSVIYPIGFSISNEAIKTFLDIAVANELITAEERLNIRKYEVFTGDRSVDKSVIAKGLLFDMYQYEEDGGTAYYPNYPLNTLGVDNLNGNVQHPHNSDFNELFTFHSPDTHFYKPFLPSEMKVEGYQFGKSGANFDIVDNHPTYVILGNKAYSLAYTLASVEVVLDMLSQGFEAFINAATATWGIAISILFAVLILALVFTGMFRIGKLAYEWVTIFRDLGNLQQFAYYSSTLGHYNSFLQNNEKLDDVSRGVATAKYLKPGRVSVPDETSAAATNFRINNLDREDSVFLNLGDYPINYPTTYRNYDNHSSNSANSSRGRVYSGKGASSRITGNVASPYSSLKQYSPAQYGSIYSVNWVHTGFCGDLEDIVDCNPILGGDTYISRFAVKRKFPYFTSNSHGLAPRTPYTYSNYFNVNPNVSTGRYFVDYLITDNNDSELAPQFIFPSYKFDFSLTNGSSSINQGSSTPFYIKPPYKFILFSYGFPYFLVESIINSNYRYAKREAYQDFYPNNQDLISMTQESNVSIKIANSYYYNFVYSSLSTTYPWRTLPSNYDRELYAKISDLDNTVIYSRKDASQSSLTDNWLIYQGLVAYDFPRTFGRLIDMDSIESETILARFENGLTLFGSIDQIRDRVTADTGNLGEEGIFAGRSINFNKTDLGYAGTQHKTKISCEYGHFWPDVKRGQVFQLKPNGKGLEEITEGLEKWFKEHLPFKITQTVQGLEQEDLDNNFKGLGVSMGWDSRSKRIFLTKLDYITKVNNIEYINKEFYIREGEVLTQISLQDPEFFEDCSFTVAYSPMTGMWISYYSFKPNYYITYNNYFQTGINYSVDTSEEGLWSHLPFLSSYQVFYGKLYPWIIESNLSSNGTTSMLESVQYWLDVRKYYDKYDFGDVFGAGFNKVWIYNSHQNSGQLNLVHQKNDDLSQSIEFPKHNVNSTDILQSETHGKWSFNYFYNLIRNERSGLPIWKSDCNQINKFTDDRLLDYRSIYKDRLRGDYFLIRLQQDEESRYKMIYRFQTDVRNFYEQ